MTSADVSSGGRLATVEGLEALVGRPPGMIKLKQISALDEGCRSILARSPLAAFGYRDSEGTSHTTLVGGTPGFTDVHSPTRISFLLPDGEAHGPVSLLVLLPGVGETLRINGRVARRRGSRTFVDILEAYVHCAQAVIRSRLWQPAGAPATPAPIQDEGPLSAPGVTDFLSQATFLALSTWDSSSGSDTSPRGDSGSVVSVLDGHTLLLPDRRGNKRTDSLHNLLEDDHLSLVALAPGRTGTLHVRGRGSITGDPALLQPLALRGIPPHAALLIHVEHAQVLLSDVLARSRVWDPALHLDQATAPNMMLLASRHLAANLAGTRQSLPGRLLGLVARTPGIGRILHRVMDSAYRSGLEKEGYEKVSVRDTRPPSELPGITVTPDRQVRVVEVRRETPSAVTIVFEDVDERQPFVFHPGQFFTLIAELEGRPVRRAYSASSVPGRTHLDVTVKHVAQGRFSTHLHETLRTGDRLSLRGPSGTFHPSPSSAHPLVLIAAGSGITPMMSMIRTLLGTPTPPRIDLLYSSRSRSETLFADELQRLELQHPGHLAVTHVLSSESGRLDAVRLEQWLQQTRPTPDAHYFLCGPDALTELATRVLDEREVARELVHRERFTSSTASAETVSAPQTMALREGARPLGSVVVEPGQTLLEAGLDAGLPMPFSCTVGSCGDCRLKLLSGQVSMDGPNCLTPEQEASGQVLTCVGRPLSPVVLTVQ